MEPKANYTLVGLFVIVFSILSIIGAFWLSYGFSDKHYKTYLAYLSESVASLNVNSTVKYDGLTVGYVSDMALNIKNPKQVELTLAIDEHVPLTEDASLIIEAQGLTGIGYINIKGGNLGSPPLRVQPGQRYPVIKTMPSLFVRLDSAVDTLTSSIISLTNNLDKLVNNENQKAFHTLIKNTAAASEQLPAVVNNLNQLTLKLNTATNQALPQTIQTLSNLEGLTHQMQRLTTELQRDPAVLISGRQSQPGPGE